MPKGFWATVSFALRQAIRLEVFGIVLVEALCFLSIYATLASRGEEMAWLAGREGIAAKFIDIGIRLLFFPLTLALASRLNRRIFGRPFPVGPVHGVFRLWKAQILFGLVLSFWILIPFALSLAVMSFLPEGTASSIIGTGLGVGTVVAGLWLILSNILYFPMVLYEGGGSFTRARALLRGQRLRLAAAALVVLSAGVIWAAATGIAVYGLFGPQAAPLAAAALILLYGPLDALIVGLYLTGAAYLDTATAVPAST